MTPSMPSSAAGWRPARSPPSSTTTTCGPSVPGAGRVEPGPVGDHVVEQLLQLGAGAGDQPHRAERVDPGRVQGVRQPLDPLPVGRAAPGPAQTATSRSSGAWKTASWVSTARASARASASPRRPAAAQEDPGEAAQRHRHRQVRHHRVRVQEPAQRARGHRLQVLQRPGHRRHQRGGQRLRADRRPGRRRSRGRPAGAPTAGGCPRWTTAGPGRGAGRTGRPAAWPRSRRTRRRRPARCRRYSRRAAIISAFFGEPARCPTRWPAWPARRRRTWRRPRRSTAPPRRGPSSSPSPREPPSIGSTIIACCQRPPVACGISGGGSTASSPVGISGAGRRGGRLTTTVLMSSHSSPRGRRPCARTYRAPRRAHGR